MYELIQVSDSCYYFDCPAKIGLIRTGEDAVCLIDSGGDKDAGKKVKRVLDANGWTLTAIYHTHSHADHIGGNAYLQKQTGCRIYAPGTELAFTRRPYLEPAFLYGGDPPASLRGKFLMAQESDASALTPQVLPAGVESFPLPGHAWDMTGFRTDEGIVFLADCLTSEATIEKYGVTFLTDPEAYLETLSRVKEMRGTLFIPSHAAPTADIRPLADRNIRSVRAVADAILTLCASPVGFDALLAGVFARFSLTMTEQQHALVGSTVRSYLSWLRRRGELEVLFRDGVLCWRTVSAPQNP